MIKKVSVIALTLVLLLGGTGMAFAAASDDAVGQGYLSSQELDHDARVELRLERIDTLNQEGRITDEQAESFKAAITERSENCEEDCTGEGRPDGVERLNIGFGYGRNGSTGDGNAQGLGSGNAKAQGMGQGNGARGTGGLHLAECI